MEPDELTYYRAVEDHFAALRGTPFLFSPKDFALLRRWWQEAVPLAAVVAGISEAIERRRGHVRGDDVEDRAPVGRHGGRSVPHGRAPSPVRTRAALPS